MDGQNIYTVNGTPILGKEEYIFWSTRMESHLKALGLEVWNSVITDYFPPNRVRTPAQKKAKKSNSMAMNTILDGLPDDVKEKIGECNSAKELWDKLKYLYSDEKSNEAFQSEQSSVYNNSSDEDSFEKYSDIEAEVNLEAELECALDELRKYKQRCKQLKDLMLEKRRKQGSKNKELEKIIVDFRIQVQLDQERLESLEQSLNKEQQKFEELKQQQLESEEENQTLKRQLMSSQEELHSSRQQATISMEEAKNLKQEVVGLKDQLKTVEKFKKGTEALDKILSLQRFPSNKSGLGYDQVHMVKGSSPITQIDVEDDMCCDDTSKETTMQQKDDKNANSYAQESAHPPKKMYQIKREDTEDIPIKDEEEDSTINKGKDSPQSFDCNNVDIEFSPASKEEDLDTIEECSVSIYPMEEVEEELSKAKQKVYWSLYEYHYDHNYSDYSFLHDYTKEFLEKSQKHILEIKEMLKDNEKIISEKNIQLEEKEKEIEKLKNEISQAKEEKKEDDELSRNLADLKELRESNVNLKTQLEEAKRREEVVRNQLNKRVESCHKLEEEVVNLRKKVEKSNTQVKFLNNSMTLDEILDSQRSPNDKSGLGYNKEEISNPKKPDASPSFVKGEDRSDAGLSFIKSEGRFDTGPSFVKGESRYDAGPSCSKNERNTTIFRRSYQGSKGQY
jgi:hypothetical protein